MRCQVPAIRCKSPLNSKKFKLTNDGGAFVINIENGNSIEIHSPLTLDNSFEGKEFKLFFLAKKDINENDIFELHSSAHSKRIGWVLPITSLCSTEHDFDSNPHFLRYAYIAIREALSNLDEDVYSHAIESDAQTLSLVDIFHESTALLIISQETLPEGLDFDIDRALPGLLKFGYIKMGNISPDSISYTSNALPSNGKLLLDLTSEKIQSYKLISELLNTSFAYEKTMVFRFFFLYQIIELLIDDVYNHQQETIIDSLNAVKGDSGKTKEKLEQLNQFLSEKGRIKLLVDDYAKIGNELDSLKKSCNSLLSSLGRDQGAHFHQYFYKIRNFIFHQYRDFSSENEDMLDDIVKDTVDVLPKILSRYCYPTSSE